MPSRVVSSSRTVRAALVASIVLPCAAISFPRSIAAQQPVVPAPAARGDTVRADTLAPGDSSRRRSARLAPVTITAAPARAEEPRGVTTITPSVMQRTPATNPWELLRQTGGIEVHQQGQGPGFASDASVRGFSSDHSTDLALWIDGVPINEPVNGHAEGYNDWSVIFPEAVQSIDVIKGPTSVLYGNFAMAGVVNVLTLERMQGTSAVVSGGSDGRVDATVMTGFDHGATGGGVFGVRGVHDGGWRPHSAYDIGQGHLRVVHDLSPATRIDAGVELYGATWDSPGYLSQEEFGAHEYDVVTNPTDGGHKRRAQERVSLRVLKGTTLWRSTLYATQGDWLLYLTIPPAGGVFEGSGSQTEEDDARYGFGATSALTWGFASGDLTIGAEGRYDRSHFQNWFTTSRMRDSSALLVRAHQTSGALFVQSNLDATPRLRLSVGGRYDLLETSSALEGESPPSATHGVLTPKAGVLFRLTGSLAAYGNVSRGFRSMDGVISDPALSPITEWAYEGGLKLSRGDLHASAALFRMDVSDEQTFVEGFGTTNGGASRRQGVELGVHVPITSMLSLSSDWTFNDARYRRLAAQQEGSAQVDTLSGLRVYNTARYVGVAALDIAPASQEWNVRLSSNVVGPYSPFDEPGVTLPAYGVVYISGSARVGKAQVELGVRNLLDRAYPELVAAELVSPGQPRSVYGTVRLHF